MLGVKLLADHWTVGGSLDVGNLDGERKVREGIDWPRLEALVGSPEEDWYHELVGHDAYISKKKSAPRRTSKHEIALCAPCVRTPPLQLTTFITYDH